MAINQLEYLLRPRSVAIVGASQKAGAIGHTTVKNFKDLGFQGKVYCVNPRYNEVEGFPCFPTVADIPDPIDLAIITVPGQFVVDAMKDCAKKKVSYVIIFSAGFAEMGEDGLKMQNEILDISKQHGIRVIGPNTMGIYNVKDKIALTFTPASTSKWLSGNVGLVSQSGATGGTILNTTEEEKIGFSYVITTGNQIDLTTLDIAEAFLEDDDTHMIAAYMEAVPDGQQLKELGMKALKKRKPIIVLKSGHSEAGQKAALSHTASMTGTKAAFELVAKEYGFTMVSDIEEITDAIKAFNSKKRLKGNRVATVVISGATGIMIADRLSEYGFELVDLTNETKKRLREIVPDYLSIENPVDIASTLLMNPSIFTHSINTLVAAEEVDALIIHLPIGKDLGGLKFAQDIVETSKKTDKPIIVLTTGTEESTADIRKYLNQNHVPAYRNIKSGVKSLHYLLEYEKIYNKCAKLSAKLTVQTTTEISWQFASNLTVTEPDVKRLLSQSGIPVPSGDIGKNLDELLQIASTLSYPLVAKIVSQDITHKSDVGGVFLPIKNQEELKRAYETIMENVTKHVPSAKIEGILIEELAQGPFLEAFVGVKRDPVFGPIIMCGLGGVYVEVIKDISQRLAPITEEDALEMIRELKSYPLFTGFRKGAKYDVQAFAKVLADISRLALNLGNQWSEIEINPLIVREEEKGVMALDGLITMS